MLSALYPGVPLRFCIDLANEVSGNVAINIRITSSMACGCTLSPFEFFILDNLSTTWNTNEVGGAL